MGGLPPPAQEAALSRRARVHQEPAASGRTRRRSRSQGGRAPAGHLRNEPPRNLDRQLIGTSDAIESGMYARPLLAVLALASLAGCHRRTFEKAHAREEVI